MHITLPKMYIKLARFILCFCGAAVLMAGARGLVDAQEASVREDDSSIVAATPNYTLRIIKRGFRFGFELPDGKIIAPPHAASGLQIGAANSTRQDAVTTTALIPGSSPNQLKLRVSTGNDLTAVVTIALSEAYAKFSIRPEREGAYSIVARTGGVRPAFGLGDHGATPVYQPASTPSARRTTTDLTGFTSDNLRGGSGAPGDTRMVSNFAIFPKHSFAVVNVEPGVKVVRFTADEVAQGSQNAREMPALYYFVGPPRAIYRAFLDVRQREGHKVYQPKYEWFGVGWEAWGALAWDTNHRTVTENVNRYLSLGYPLRWMVIGSGFWRRDDDNYHATTSFGMWDPKLYPDPRGLIDSFHQRGLKVILGLRIAFITEGPFAQEGTKGGFFLTENGRPKAFTIGFPRKPVYLLDASNARAVAWYINLCRKWLDYGVDGFKEDLFGYDKYELRDDKIDAVNRQLMEMGVYVMGRNMYLGSPADLHRYNDFNYDQNQDRGPLNGLTLAYSGFPYVYPDIVGGTFAENDQRQMPPLSDEKLKRYYMRNAQYAAVNPSMSVGFAPWNFKDERVERVLLDAAKLHARLHPYIYSAALDAYRTGFPATLTPLALAYPADPEVYRLENTTRRGYQWMIGESLLATPLYGEDYATAETRDVYLPRGRWIDYDTGQLYQGPTTLKNFALPIGKTPLFVGGKGVVIEAADHTNDDQLTAVVYPVAPRGSEFTFTYRDARTISRIRNDNSGWNGKTLTVTDITAQKTLPLKHDPRTGSVAFELTRGHDYRLSGGN